MGTQPLYLLQERETRLYLRMAVSRILQKVLMVQSRIGGVRARARLKAETRTAAKVVGVNVRKAAAVVVMTVSGVVSAAVQNAPTGVSRVVHFTYRPFVIS